MNPENEAAEILQNLVKQFSTAGYDIISIMRQCQFVCEIMDWQDAKLWFHQEINGYNADSPLPSHRKINGIQTWKFEGSIYESVSYQTDKSMYGLDKSVYTEEPDVLDVQTGIQWFLSASETGYTENLTETKKALAPSGKKQIVLRKIRMFSQNSIQSSLSQIERMVFDWISKSYVQLQYGNRVMNLWENYRNTVDKVLQQLELSNHLSVIQDEIRKDNPEAWRTAVLACRNLLNDVANYLWADPKETYDNLPGNGDNGKLSVKLGQYVNRLSAYLHQKSVTGTQGKFLRDEAERLSVSIRSLVSLASSAHQPIEKPLAEMVVLSTFFILGELARKTDLEPITQYN
jgi:hypothetical protein